MTPSFPTRHSSDLGREWKACCPFHNEKTPSFYVNDDKGFYHCFGCGAHGDGIRFLTDHEGLAFRDAVERLAVEAGLEMPQESGDSGAVEPNHPGPMGRASCGERGCDEV